VYSVDEQKLIIKDAADYYDKSHGLDLLLEKIKKVEQSIKQQKNILVIDDESRIRKIYRHYLQEHGYRIIEVHDGSAGLDILRKNNEIALVILDLAMPGKSGFEIYETIKKEFPNIKILIASVFSKNDQKFFLPDADEYYDKSEDPASLIKKIEKLIDLNSSL
ncbi:MAG: response regulator, partial [Candidatus Omnitrophica bacterium]|nr:response regulator [Candidatus Omnitrophota bacterium]